jgi:hypothetical protein
MGPLAVQAMGAQRGAKRGVSSNDLAYKHHQNSNLDFVFDS